jgi:hypothetical protein
MAEKKEKTRAEMRAAAMALPRLGDVFSEVTPENPWPWVDDFKNYDAASRKRMAKEGTALPDGSYPIANCEDAMNARRAIGRANPADRGKVRSHINSRERALGCKNGDPV